MATEQAIRIFKIVESLVRCLIASIRQETIGRQQTGWANGAPELAHPSQYQAWAAVLGEEFRTLQARVTRGAPSLLGDYAATDPAEFFAVASEVFFEQPGAMAQEHPALYQQFTQYYQVDPRGW